MSAKRGADPEDKHKVRFRDRLCALFQIEIPVRRARERERKREREREIGRVSGEAEGGGTAEHTGSG